MRFRGAATALAVSLLCSALLAAAPARAGVSIAVTPAILDLAAPSGGSGTIEIAIENLGDDPIEVDSSVIDLSTAVDLPSAVAWSTVGPAELRVEPGDRSTFTLRLDVPQKAALGGHYEAVSLSTRVPTDAGPAPSTSGVSGRIVVPVLITVIGDDDHPTPEAIPVLERAALFLQRDGSLLAQAELANRGGTHIALDGDARVQASGSGPDDPPLATSEISVGRILPSKTRLYPAYTPFALAPGRAYVATVELGEASDGRASGAPLVSDRFELVATPHVSLEGLTACLTPDGLLRASVAMVNEGTLGVASTVDFWAELPDIGRVAAAQQVPEQLAWPQDTLHLISTIERDLREGAYTLVAEASYGTGGLLRAELPLVVSGDIPTLPACTSDRGALG